MAPTQGRLARRVRRRHRLQAFTPFPLDISAHQIGLIFFGWGMALAFTSVVVAPRLQRRFGTARVLIINLLAFSALLAVMAVVTNSKAALAACVLVAGLFTGVNNTLITETVMKAAPVERGVATASCGSVAAPSPPGWPASWVRRQRAPAVQGRSRSRSVGRGRTGRHPSVPDAHRRRRGRTSPTRQPRSPSAATPESNSSTGT